MLDFLVYAVSVGTETAGQGEKKYYWFLSLPVQVASCMHEHFYSFGIVVCKFVVLPDPGYHVNRIASNF